MESILSYLDKVENDTARELAESRCGSVCSFDIHYEGETSDLKDDNSSVAQSSVFGGIKTKMINMKVQLEDQDRTVSVLKKALDESKNRRSEMKKEHEIQIKKKVESIQKENELATARHLKFIDRLLTDKDVLSKDCSD